MGIANDELKVACPRCKNAVITSVVYVEGTRRERTIKGTCAMCSVEVTYSYFPCVKCTRMVVEGTISSENKPGREHW
jgi:hypothetical protein